MNDLKHQILVVDDNRVNRCVLSELLEEEYKLALAQSGEEALEVAEWFVPDLVLLDVAMPGIDGFQTCQKLRQMPHLDGLKVVMLSARTELADRLRGFEVGADDYITKPFDGEEVLAKIKVLSRMGTAIEVASLRETVGSTRNLAESSLVNLARLRDAETGGHLQRMRLYSRVLAEHLRDHQGLEQIIDDAFLTSLDRASALHDVGKVGIPDRILKKPGPLTPHEYDIMKSHTLLGATMIEQSIGSNKHGAFLKMAAVVARSHHEKIDGTGYPDALRGASIPLPARIVALADVFDALTSKRVYKEASAPKDAREIIRKASGHHFDPAVVRTFEACFGEFCRIREEEADDTHADNDEMLSTLLLSI